MNLVECDGCEKQTDADSARTHMWWVMRRTNHVGDERRRDLCMKCGELALAHVRRQHGLQGGTDG